MGSGLRLDVLLEDVLHDKAKGVHCFSSGFFKLIEHRNGGVYDTAEGPMHTTYSTDRALAAS